MAKYLLDLPDPKMSALKRISQSINVPVAGLIRGAIDSFLNQEQCCQTILSGQMTSGNLVVVRVG